LNISFVGLGSMGRALARRPQPTHMLNVHDDIDPAAVARMVEQGALV
jgi:3-hydroxyisobutyrate dehydrogenase-like beta-hydroxyacid dehydrogenase